MLYAIGRFFKRIILKIRYLFSESLHQAVERGHTERVKAMIRDGFDVNARDANGNTPLHVAIESYYNADCFTTLIEAGADLHAKNHADEPPIVTAYKCGKFYHVKNMQSLGAKLPNKILAELNINAPNLFPLRRSERIQARHVQCLKRLLA